MHLQSAANKKKLNCIQRQPCNDDDDDEKNVQDPRPALTFLFLIHFVVIVGCLFKYPAAAAVRAKKKSFLDCVWEISFDQCLLSFLFHPEILLFAQLFSPLFLSYIISHLFIICFTFFSAALFSFFVDSFFYRFFVVLLRASPTK